MDLAIYLASPVHFLPNNDWLTPQRIALLRELFSIGVHWQGEN